MPINSRRKGAQWERDVANMLRPIWPDAERGIGQTRQGSEVADVDGCPYRIECKVGKQPNIWKVMVQARTDAAKAKDTRPVLVVAKKDREPPTATLELDQFLKLMAVLSRVQAELAYAVCNGVVENMSNMLSTFHSTTKILPVMPIPEDVITCQNPQKTEKPGS